MPTTTPAAPTTRITNPKERVIAINGSAGALVLISCSKFCRYVEISECAPGGGSFTGGNFNPQGINYNLPDDGYVATYALLPGATLSFGDQSWHRDQQFGVPPMTDPAGNSIVGTPILKAISAQAGTTQLLVREWS
jgi:hypothetical protein